MSREFWELADTELWAEVDAAWLLEQFRRSEISEEREQERAREFSRWGMSLDSLIHVFYQGLVEAITDGFVRGITATELNGFVEQLSQEPEPELPARPPAPTPRAWYAQLPLNSRALRDHNTKLPRPRLRRSQHR